MPTLKSNEITFYCNVNVHIKKYQKCIIITLINKKNTHQFTKWGDFPILKCTRDLPLRLHSWNSSSALVVLISVTDVISLTNLFLSVTPKIRDTIPLSINFVKINTQKCWINNRYETFFWSLRNVPKWR